MIEIITLCGVAGSIMISSFNVFLNWYRTKDVSLKKYSKSIFIDRSMNYFVKFIAYIKNNNNTQIYTQELLSIKNDKLNLTCFIPSQTFILENVYILPCKNNNKQSITGYILTSDNLEDIDNLCKNIFNEIL